MDLIKTVDYFLNMECAGDVINTGAVGSADNIKRIVDFYDLLKKQRFNTYDSGSTLLVFGDKSGAAAIFAAFMTAWQCYNVNDDYVEPNERVYQYDTLIADDLNNKEFDNAIIVVFGNDAREAINLVRAKQRHIVVIPDNPYVRVEFGNIRMSSRHSTSFGKYIYHACLDSNVKNDYVSCEDEDCDNERIIFPNDPWRHNGF